MSEFGQVAIQGRAGWTGVLPWSWSRRWPSPGPTLCRAVDQSAAWGCGAWLGERPGAADAYFSVSLPFSLAIRNSPMLWYFTSVAPG